MTNILTNGARNGDPAEKNTAWVDSNGRLWVKSILTDSSDNPIDLNFHAMPFSEGLRLYVATGKTASMTIIFE